MKRASILAIIPLIVSISALGQEGDSTLLRQLTARAYECYLAKPDTSVIISTHALQHAIAAEDAFYEGYCYYLLAKAYWVKANYQLSTDYGFKALKVFEDSPYHTQLDETRLALARNLVELGNVPKAREFIADALDAGLSRNDERIQAAAYREQSYLLAEVNEPDSSLSYADKGLRIFEKLRDSLEISVLYGRKSRIYFQQGKFSQSRNYAYRAMIIDSLVGNRRGLGISYYQMAQNEYAVGTLPSAISYLKKSVRINDEIGNLTWQIKGKELLSEFYLELDQPELAAEALKQVSEFKDELYNSEKNGQIQEMQSLHELEAKENTIKLLEQEYSLKQQQVKNQRLFVAFLLVAILFLVLLTFLLTRLRSIQARTNRNLASQNLEIAQQKSAIQVQAENLRQLDEVKTKLFSVVSHDLRGPISNLQSLLDLFTKKLMSADEFVSLSGKLKENLNVTQRTLENLLNWSLSQMGGIKTEKRKIDITECIREACSLMEEVAARKNIVLRQHYDAPMKVWADRDQLQVVLRNLIHNAIKFSSFDDTIDVSASSDGTTCRVCIKDSGIGMTRDEIQAIVDSNKYLSKSGTEQERGTGLGLVLCKEFISLNGGEIAINSVVGGGTEVCFTLVLSEQENTHELVPR